MSKMFSEFLKMKRKASGLTLREFCLAHGLDPGNYSRIETGRFAPPQKQSLLERYAKAFGLTEGTDDWLEFFDLAAASRGELPKDLLSDEQVVEKLPVLFRTLRGKPLDPDKLDDFVEKIRRS